MTVVANFSDIYCGPCHEQIIAAVIKRVPEWLRRDLLSDDHVARSAAEEALSAMIASALAAKQP